MSPRGPRHTRATRVATAGRAWVGVTVARTRSVNLDCPASARRPAAVMRRRTVRAPAVAKRASARATVMVRPLLRSVIVSAARPGRNA